MSAVLVYGGAGALGEAVVKHCKHVGKRVISVDINVCHSADKNVKITGDSPLIDVGTVLKELNGEKLEAILCVAGGWSGGDVSTEGMFESVEKMWKFNVNSSVGAGHLAAKALAEGGLLVLTGASAALGATPGMIGYGVSKAAVHQLVSSLGAPNSKLPANSSVLAILPITLDTPNNRKWMPTADFTTWTPCDALAEKLTSWMSHANRPPTGSLIEVVTKDSKTHYYKVTTTVTKSEL